MYTVYLSGPMQDTMLSESTGWRDYVSIRLPSHIRPLDPFRGKMELLNKVTNNGAIKLGTEHRLQNPLTCPKGITARDRFDATRCDVLLVNVLGAKKVSIGTVMEIAWADAMRIPIIVVMEKEGNIHDHAILNEVTGFRVETLDEGITVLQAILTP